MFTHGVGNLFKLDPLSWYRNKKLTQIHDWIFLYTLNYLYSQQPMKGRFNVFLHNIQVYDCLKAPNLASGGYCLCSRTYSQSRASFSSSVIPENYEKRKIFAGYMGFCRWTSAKKFFWAAQAVDTWLWRFIWLHV